MRLPELKSLEIRPTLQALLIGITAAYCSMTPNLWPITLFVFIPFIALLEEKNISHAQAMKFGAFLGLGYSGTIFLWTTRLLGALLSTDLPSTNSIVMFFISWALIVFSHIPGYSLWAFATKSLFSICKRYHLVSIGASILFVVAELLNICLYQLVFYGDGGTLAPHFSFAMSGYALAQNEIPLQYAWFGGVWLLSYIVIFANFLLYKYFRDGEKMALYILLTLVLVPCLTFFFRSSQFLNDAKTIKIGLVRTNVEADGVGVTSSIAEMRYRALNMQLLSLVGQRSQLIILPEESGLARSQFAMNESDVSRGSFQKLLGEGSVILDEGSEEIQGRTRARLRYWGAPHETYSDKHVLQAQGEYVPLFEAFLDGFTLEGKTKEALDRFRTLSPGRIEDIVSIANAKIAARSCSESVSPFLYLYDAHVGAQLFVNVASHNWFPQSEWLAYRTENIAKEHAVESSRWYIQAGNETSSFVVNEMGILVARVDEDHPRTIDVELHDETTPYQAIANFFIYELGY